MPYGSFTAVTRYVVGTKNFKNGCGSQMWKS